jgi:hypothetical protein
MYPWDDALIADLGMLTLPQFRRKGHACRVAQSLCRDAYDRGYEAQYQLSDRQAAVRVSGQGMRVEPIRTMGSDFTRFAD